MSIIYIIIYIIIYLHHYLHGILQQNLIFSMIFTIIHIIIYLHHYLHQILQQNLNVKFTWFFTLIFYCNSCCLFTSIYTSKFTYNPKLIFRKMGWPSFFVFSNLTFSYTLNREDKKTFSPLPKKCFLVPPYLKCKKSCQIFVSTSTKNILVLVLVFSFSNISVILMEFLKLYYAWNWGNFLRIL